MPRQHRGPTRADEERELDDNEFERELNRDLGTLEAIQRQGPYIDDD